jgi:hypothetical protein
LCGESKASTDFALVVAAESFLRGANFTAPGVATLNTGFSTTIHSPVWQGIDYDEIGAWNDMLAPAARSAAKWANLSIDDCLSTYEDPTKPLTTRRPVVMVVSNEDEPQTAGWIPAEIRLPSGNYTGYAGYNDSRNALWLLQKYYRTDIFVGLRAFEERCPLRGEKNFKNWDIRSWITSVLDIDTGTATITPDLSLFRAGTKKLKAHYCLSERFELPCSLFVHNRALLIVVAFLPRQISRVPHHRVFPPLPRPTFDAWRCNRKLHCDSGPDHGRHVLREHAA